MNCICNLSDDYFLGNCDATPRVINLPSYLSLTNFIGPRDGSWVRIILMYATPRFQSRSIAPRRANVGPNLHIQPEQINEHLTDLSGHRWVRWFCCSKWSWEHSVNTRRSVARVLFHLAEELSANGRCLAPWNQLDDQANEMDDILQVIWPSNGAK